MRVDVVREPLSVPFSFKGRTVDELWHTAVLLDSGAGEVSVQSPVWSDPTVADALGLDAANAVMLDLTRTAAGWLEPGHPVDVTTHLLARLAEVSRHGVRPSDTFLLNALVPLDCALWHDLIGRTGAAGLDDVIPAAARPWFGHRHEVVRRIPIITGSTTPIDLVRLATSGAPVLKVKIGQSGAVDEMRELDVALVERVHAHARRISAPDTVSGRVLYYLDANGRYPELAQVDRFLNALSAEARERILVLEEPLPVDCDVDVSGLGVPVGADESAHGLPDLERRAAYGYTRLAVKPIAKTPTMAYAQVTRAAELGMAPIVADLTANPCLARWSTAFAARLATLPELRVAVAESNGADHYRDWTQMTADLAAAESVGPAHTVAGRYATARLSPIARS